MNHTPGPWITESTTKTPNGLDEIIKSAAGNPCIGWAYRPEDAALIAAAPTMLEVLEEVEECSRYWSEYDVPLGLHDRIKAAIAKGRGE